ncbi:hypothetical protein FPOAC1_000225 [Fusarium poae]|uniref:hypothetical protein n=1 Tax=Fusarium poae TaxID=36050 RepID=UPI001CE7A344|nr:hypothetical protein FPOAC1_000225 [Fusarium poae]KAG8674261.1 hypothetical protein FPOAC1_000225 [Fusarium poae]
MDKSSEKNISAPSKVKPPGGPAPIANIAPMLAPFLYDCNNWSDRLVQLQNDVSKVHPRTKEQTEKDWKL